MPIDQLLESLIDAGAQVDNLWSMYIVVNLGLFWFFFLMQRPLIFVERIVALVAYAAFSIINGNALIASYRLLEAIRVDLVNNMQRGAENAPAILSAVSSVTYVNRPDLIWATHGGAIVFVILVLTFRNAMIEYYKRHYPEYFVTMQKVGAD
jgi:hypothetical protein